MAYLAGPFRGEFYQYTTGIERAIDLLLKDFATAKRDSAVADTLVYPLGLLCRHLIELRIKELHREAFGEDAPRSHDLLALWRDVRAEIERIWPDENEALNYLGALIKTLHDLDPSGQSFRYPGSFKDGAVSLDKLGEVAKEISQSLDAYCTGFYELSQALPEIQGGEGEEMTYCEDL
jgi:hypothetical protein